MYEEYHQVARALGLRVVPDDPGIMTFSFGVEGTVDGRPVRMLRVCGKGAHITTTSPLLPSLDLGLGLKRAGVLSSIAELFGAHDITVGDPAFDSAFAIRGDEPERVNALLGPAVRKALSTLRGEITLTDSEVSIDLGVGNESVAELDHTFREVVHIAHMIEIARPSVPPASALRAHHDAWMAFAQAHQLRTSLTPLMIEGRVGRTLIAARAARKKKSAGEMEIDLSVGADQSLDAGLFTRSRGSDLGALPYGAAQITTGDDAFDTRFDTFARNPEQATGLLDANIRRGLLELQAVGFVFCDDRGIAIHAPAASFDPARFAGVIETMRALVETRFTAQLAYR